MDQEQRTPSGASILGELAGLNTREMALAVRKMNMGQKKLLAMKGNAAIRKMLLRDPNSEVQLAVVASPKATESEIESVAQLPATSDIVLKSIFSDARWMKSYRIKHGLAKNPKTPLNIVQRCLRSLTVHDLKKLSQSPYLRKPVIQAVDRLLKTRK